MTYTQFMTQRKSHMSATGRAVDDGKGEAPPKPTDKSFKDDAYRLHWKGERDNDGKTSGITPLLTTRHPKDWTKEHKAVRDEFSQKLLHDPNKNFTNPFGQHGAENSHLLAASLHGPNDILSAPPASIHQNTEWMAIEEGIKNNNSMKDMRLKVTGYVHDAGQDQGVLKAARYKIHLNGAKVFDHVALGNRNNIEESEVKALRTTVSSLKPGQAGEGNFFKGPSHKGTPHKGLGSGEPPDQTAAGRGHASSVSSPLFTGLKDPKGTHYKGQDAFEYARGRYKQDTSNGKKNTELTRQEVFKGSLKRTRTNPQSSIKRPRHK